MPSCVDIQRWLDDQIPISPPSRKRKLGVLQEMSGNAQCTPETPDKRRKRSLSPQNTWEDTPRAPSVSLANFSIPEIPPRSRSPSRDDGTGSSYVTTESAASSASKRRRRNPSPRKELAIRQHAPYKIVLGNLHNLVELSNDAKSLAAKMRRVAAARGIFSGGDDTEQMRETLNGGYEDPEDLALLFDKTGERRHLGTMPLLSDMQELVNNADLLRRAFASEPAWNCSVHWPLLQMAWKGCLSSQAQRWHNVTTATIFPQSLILNINERERSPSKKVDFCLAFATTEHTKDVLQYAGIQLNQTEYFPVLYDPIAISIETKVPDMGGADAKVQLSTWASAQVTRLRHLLIQCGNGSVEIPVLPLLLVQGHQWKFCAFKDHNDGGSSATFYDDGVEFGTTATVRGAYQVVAGLQYLMDWAEKEYRPWFESHILNPIIKLTRRPQ